VNIADYDSMPIIMDTNSNPIQLPAYFQGLTTVCKIDRIRYTAPRGDHNRIVECLGRVSKTRLTKGILTRFHHIEKLDRTVRVSDWPRNTYRFWIDVDDPSVAVQKFFLELFRRLRVNFNVSQVEVAYDLQPGLTEEIELVARFFLSHMTLPYARKDQCHYVQDEDAPDPGTWYLGNLRGKSKGWRIYDKVLGKVLRLEVQINRRFEAYGISRRTVIDIQAVRLEKLVVWRRFDLERAVELAYRRMTKKSSRRRVCSGRNEAESRRLRMGIGVTLAHIRAQITWELTKPGGADHVPVLAQMMDRYRKTIWSRRHDIDLVFPKIHIDFLGSPVMPNS